jgi:hypothetical protein
MFGQCESSLQNQMDKNHFIKDFPGHLAMTVWDIWRAAIMHARDAGVKIDNEYVGSDDDQEEEKVQP